MVDTVIPTPVPDPTPAPAPEINPVIGGAVPKINPEFLVAQQKMANSLADYAVSMRQLVAADSGDVFTEGGLYLKILLVCISAKIGETSNETQAIAKDFMEDYLRVYKLTGEKIVTTP